MSYEGQAITLWSVRLSLVFYVIALSIVLLDSRDRFWHHQRWAWTIGCALFVLHVFCAFQFVHLWSHENAIRETARQTFEVAGIDWGGGLFFNYVFALIWIVDVCWCWIFKRGYQKRNSIWSILLHTFFLFIAFNATVIFETGATRWVGIAASVWLIALVWISIRRKSTVAQLPEPE